MNIILLKESGILPITRGKSLAEIFTMGCSLVNYLLVKIFVLLFLIPPKLMFSMAGESILGLRRLQSGLIHWIRLKIRLNE
ncbi:hypothetical protein AA671_15645 [Delftia tsuruhatensis]|uniref:Uncharacterized protein n=1 Tax=Delftia tsuruhatensis TaxID=180282 RepID=A0ABN4SEZ3_9BURK|nr:hypothetical protein BI380_11170 [Delftia tsuruhatensis]KLO58256.1 hypothetical protein AA671_15645 [Delftia tsuruhatensis]